MGQSFCKDYKRYSPINVDGRTVIFFTQTGSQLMLSVQSIDIPNTPSNWIQVYDGDSVSSPTIAGGTLRGSKPPTNVFTSSGTSLTLSFHSDGSKWYNFKVDMFITSFHTGVCSSDEFKCSNRRCISSSIRYKGANPCGDYSGCNNATLDPCVYPDSCGVEVKYLEDYCDKDIFIQFDEQFELKLTRKSSYASNMDCKPTIISSGKMMVYFKWIAIDWGWDKNCSSAYTGQNLGTTDYAGLNDGTYTDLSLLGAIRFVVTLLQTRSFVLVAVTWQYTSKVIISMKEGGLT